MSLEIGFSAQTPSLPQGGGAVGSLGETFTPDTATGTGTFTIPLDGPNGPNDIAPRLALRYDTGIGSGPFGMGFALPLPRVVRSASHGFPHYTPEDRLFLEGASELIPQGDGSYRLQVDSGVWQIVAHGEGFRLTDQEGRYYYLGTSSSARLFPADDPGKIFAWHLERIEDPLGNSVQFEWLREDDQLYLKRVSYSIYEIEFHYTPRPDVLRNGRTGFLITTALRCDRIELRLPSEPQPLLRRWTLSYTQAEGNGCSLLSQVVMSGFDEQGQSLDTPPLHLGYSRFEPRQLIRFRSQGDGTRPGPLSRNGRHCELVDWNGDGLPDLLEITGGGAARVWPNLGECTWGTPHSAGRLPSFALPEAISAMVDMNGDGLADLVRVDHLRAGYTPRTINGFERPVSWQRAPSVSPLAPNSRIVDLDGDGAADLLTSSPGYLALYYRTEPDGWADRPQVVPRGLAPDVDLSDPRTFVADMTGDGTADLVRVKGSTVTYWPYLGNGRWDEPVHMENAPVLPFDLQPERLLLSDIDGDGCADLVYLDQGRLRYWINQAGSRFSDEHVIDWLPTGQLQEVRLADMRGNGIVGLLWSVEGPFYRGAAYFYLDFGGDSKPYLLTEIDNGIGLTTHIVYTTSAQEAARDLRRGEPWMTALPVVVQVVKQVTQTDTLTDTVATTRYHYHDGRFDGALREFAGFGWVEEQKVGDETAPSLLTAHRFHNGVDLAAPQHPLTDEERRRLRTLRGRLYKQERYGLDGSPLEDLPYDRQEQDWTVAIEETPGGPVYQPRLVKVIRTIYEREPNPAAIVTTTNLAWDSSGNVTELLETSAAPADPAQTRQLHTQKSFVNDPTGRFRRHVYRVQQFDEHKRVVADTITRYDGMPEGQIGAQGLVTRRTSLILTDELVEEVYGQDQPDFEQLGYFRRPGEPGWWIDEARYERVEDAAGLRGRVFGPLGAATTFEFEPYRLHPARVTDPHGNAIQSKFNYRVYRVASLTDASGAEYRASFDALGRQTARIEPGDSLTLPTVTFSYEHAAPQVEVTISQRAVSGQAETIDTRQIYDGFSRLIEKRARDEQGEITLDSRQYSSRGLPARVFFEHRPSSGDYSSPGLSNPHITLQCDALGRLIHQRNPDDSFRTIQYGPLYMEQADEEDTRTDIDAQHAGTPTRTVLYATGYVAAIEENLGGTTLRSTYTYNIKGQILLHTDATGNETRFWYDLLGRTLRVDRPESSQIAVYDAAGNAVEARTPGAGRVLREFDACNRPTAVWFDSPDSPPTMKFIYHDVGKPPPAEAGQHTAGGQCVRIDDEGGVTVLDYDERGRLAVKRTTPVGHNVTYELSFAYRADGQLDTITYPNTGSGRPIVRYEYNLRGLLARIPGFVSKIDYDLRGQRTLVRYANHIEHNYKYHPNSGRLQEFNIFGPNGDLRRTFYHTDTVGNVLHIDSPDPNLAVAYRYDDLYRLVEAKADTGEAWNYSYDEAGNLTYKSDVGVYHYGEQGHPVTCLTTAGNQTFTYTARGEMQSTPWGEMTYDQMGRLERIISPDTNRITEFRYDYQGRRVARQVSESGTGSSERLTPDLLYMVDEGIVILQIFDGQGIVAQQTATARLFFHNDHLGSLVLITDGNGQTAGTIRYDPYGAVLEGSGLLASVNRGYIGGVPEASSGLLYLGARYYHPVLGRFTSPDRIVQRPGVPSDWSSYLYCHNNPILYRDPSGRGPFDMFLGAVGIGALVALLVVSGPPGWVVGATIAGMVLGGVIGGVAAHKKGGDFGDVLSGVLVGAAVGGWSAYASAYAGAAVAKTFGLSGTFWGSVISSSVNGVINGAGSGFTVGYAGGRGSFDDILKKMMYGALIGAVTGAILGAWSTQKPKTFDEAVGEVTDPLKPPNGSDPGGWLNWLENARTATSRAVDAATGYGLGFVQPYMTHQIGQIVVVDAVSGAWNLGFAQSQIEGVATALFIGLVVGPLISEVLTVLWMEFMEALSPESSPSSA